MLRQFANDPREQQAARYFGDGLFDLVLGSALTLIAVLIAGGYDLAGLPFIAPLLAFALLPALKHAITTPRLAGDDLPPATEQRMRQATTVGLVVVGGLLVLGLLVFALASAGSIEPVPRAGATGGIAAVLLLLLGVYGWAGSARRFGAYIALALLLAAGSLWLQPGLAIPLLVLGLVILLGGIVVLNRFLRTHPRLQGGPA